MDEQKHILVTWIGHNDFRAASDTSLATEKQHALRRVIETELDGLPEGVQSDFQRVLRKWCPKTKTESSFGPIGHLLQHTDPGTYDRIVVLNNSTRDSDWQTWEEWATEHRKTGVFVDVPIEMVRVSRTDLPDPTDHRVLWGLVRERVQELVKKEVSEPALSFLISPGTPAMATTLVLLANSIFPDATVIRTDREKDGVRQVQLPEALAVAYFQTVFHRPIERSDAFQDIVCSPRSEAMARMLESAERLAELDVRVLLEGETGAGKSLVAVAMHARSGRKGAFRAVNCGAIPPELVESTLFGHKRGAFTGATEDAPGLFEQADGGTLFLDEIGELPLAAQVKLLLALDTGQVTRVGDSKPISVDVRILAATHRILTEEVERGAFRADLYYRIARFTLRIPPLRERHRECIELLIEGFQKDMLAGDETRSGGGRLPDWAPLAPSAMDALVRYRWPGNVRELEHVLWRAQFERFLEGSEADGPLTDIEIQRVLPAQKPEDWFTLDAPFPTNLKRDLFDRTMAHYIERALRESKTKYAAAAALEIRHQTLTHHMKRLRDLGLLDRKSSSS